MGRSNGHNLCFCLPEVEEPLKKDGKFYLMPRRFKGFILLYGKKDSQFPFQAMVGPHYCCMIATYTLILVPSVFFILNVAVDWGIAMVIPSVVILGALIIIFSLTACSDPGIAFDRNQDEEIGLALDGTSAHNVNLIECGTCKIKRPPNAFHCYDCGVCVSNLDHHCPWTGKCIGQKNIKYFHSFLSLLMLQIGFVLVCTIVAALGDNDIYSND
jgi:hypothetical protein